MKASLIDKYKALPKVARATFWFTVCNFFVAGLGFITGPIFTRLIPENEYGKLTVFLTYEQIILILATWELHNGAYQRGLFRYADNIKGYTKSTLYLINVLTVITFIIGIVFSEIIVPFTGFSQATVLLLFLYMLTMPAYYCWTIRKRTEYDYQPAVIATIGYSFMNIIFPMVAVIYIGNTADVKFNTTLFISFLFGLIFYANSLRDIKECDNIKQQWNYMLAYQAPLVLHSLSYLVLGQADRIMISKMIGDTEAAYYGVAYTLASAIIILQNSLQQALVPWRYRKLEEKQYTTISSVTNVLLIGFGLAICCFTLIAPEIFKILFPDNYHEAIWCIPPVACGIFFMFLYSLFVNVETYYEKTKYIMYVSVFCGLVNIAANYLFIPYYGYLACAYTTLGSYILFAILHYFCMKIVVSKVDNTIKVYSGLTISIISMVLLGFIILITFLYDSIMIRLTILLIFILIGVYKKSYIIQILKTIKKG